jgi:type IV secretion system protein VirB2
MIQRLRAISLIGARQLHHLTMTASVAVVSLMMAAPAHASGSSMPWEAPLQSILQSIEGPVAKIIAVIIIITTGLTLAFGDTSGGFRRLIQIVFGLSIAFAASSFFLSFFSFGGGRWSDGGRRRSGRTSDSVPGYTVPLHRALTEPILLGGAPRAIAI